MEYQDHVRRLRDQDPALAEALAGLTSLEHVLAWLRERQFPLAGLDLVAQDEFCHDVLVPLPDGRWLAFGVT